MENLPELKSHRSRLWWTGGILLIAEFISFILPGLVFDERLFAILLSPVVTASGIFTAEKTVPYSLVFVWGAVANLFIARRMLKTIPRSRMLTLFIVLLFVPLAALLALVIFFASIGPLVG